MVAENNVLEEQYEFPVIQKGNKHIWEKWMDNTVYMYIFGLLWSVNYHTKFWFIMKKTHNTCIEWKETLSIIIEVSYFAWKNKLKEVIFLAQSHMLSYWKITPVYSTAGHYSSNPVLISVSLIINISRTLMEKPFYSFFTVSF